MKYYTYRITNTINGSIYYGYTSTTIERRWQKHQDTISKHPKLLLYRSMKKHGIKNFIIEQVSIHSSKESAFTYEIKLILEGKTNRLRFPTSGGLNMTDGGESPPNHTGRKLNNYKKLRGRKLSEEHKRNISKGLTGRVCTKKTREKLKLKSTNRLHTPEAKRKISESRLGIKLSSEHKQNISNGLTGKAKSKTHRENLSKALTGKIRSKAHRENLSKANMGRNISNKTRKALSMALKGRVKSNIHNEKTSLALKGRKFKNERIQIIMLDGTEIIHKTLKEAGNFLNKSPALISKITKSKSNEYMGYIIKKIIV